MKIAFISYEYPPDTAYGGIATYVKQAVRMLLQRDCYIEVFAGSLNETKTKEEEGVIVHRVKVSRREDFREKIGIIFAQRYNQIKFDVLEAPEIGVEAARAIELVPEIPVVIKLHTPSYIVRELGYTPLSFRIKVRRYIGALRRGKLPKPFPKYSYNSDLDLERTYALKADEIAAPSQAIGNKLIQDWGINTKKVSLVPLPYIPSSELLKIPIKTETNTITFIGRLEIRKGILDLAAAIPFILKQFPQVKFRFIGASWNLPHSDLDMRQHLERKFKKYIHNLEFVGKVSLSRIPFFLADTDICVFPSLWESFGLVCAEAMAAGRGVVGSSAGGMAELLDGGKVGKLVPPKSPKLIAKAIIELLENPEERIRLGQAARQRVLNEYNLHKIGALQEASYLRAIKAKNCMSFC